MASEPLHPALKRQVAAGTITQSEMDVQMARDILRNFDDYSARPYPQPSKEMAAYVIGRCNKTSLRSQALARTVGLWVALTYDLMAYNAKSLELVTDDAILLGKSGGNHSDALAAIERCVTGHKRAAENLDKKLLHQADKCMAIEANDRSAGAPSHDGPTRMVARLPS
jgi:hypothetical protein